MMEYSNTAQKGTSRMHDLFDKIYAPYYLCRYVKILSMSVHGAGGIICQTPLCTALPIIRLKELITIGVGSAREQRYGPTSLGSTSAACTLTPALAIWKDSRSTPEYFASDVVRASMGRMVCPSAIRFVSSHGRCSPGLRRGASCTR